VDRPAAVGDGVPPPAARLAVAVWPEDRSWFVGVPIYTNEIAVASTTVVVDAVVAYPRLSARRATPDDGLDIDD
jgi:hypothetical protein